MTAGRGELAQLAGALGAGVSELTLEQVAGQRWFAHKGARQLSAGLELAYCLGRAEHWLLVVRLDLGEQVALYSLPIRLQEESSRAALFRCAHRGRSLSAVDGLDHPAYLRDLLETAQRGQATYQGGPLRSASSAELAGYLKSSGEPSIRRITSEQSNSSVILDGWAIVKLYRNLASGLHPDLEMAEYFAGTSFRSTPAFLGSLILGPGEGLASMLAVRFERNSGDLWVYLTGLLGQLAQQANPELEAQVRTLTEQLATVTGEMHLALAQGSSADYKPEPTSAEQVSQWQQQVLTEFDRTLESAAAQGWEGLPWLSGRRGQLQLQLQGLNALVGTNCIRVHGDYHLGQVLVAERGLLVLDFEGEPARPLRERRARQPALRDVAGMLRSLTYAATYVELNSRPAAQGLARLRDWAASARERFVQVYLETVGGAGGLLPSRPQDTAAALRTLELQKALYELRYELANRPDWVAVPRQTLQETLGS